MGNLKTLPYEQLVWFNNCLSDKSINLFWSRQLYETRFWQVSCRYLRVVFVIHNWLRGNGYKHQGRFNSDGFVRDLRALHAFRHWSSSGNKATMCKTSKQDVEIKCLMITDTIICTTNYSTISNISVCNSKSNALYKSDFQKLGEWHFFYQVNRVFLNVAPGGLQHDEKSSLTLSRIEKHGCLEDFWRDV